MLEIFTVGFVLVLIALELGILVYEFKVLGALAKIIIALLREG